MITRRENCRICGNKINQLQGKKRSRCNPCNTRIRRHRVKIAAIQFLGGKCKECGYNRCRRALEFHHKDPTQKEINLSKIANKKWEVVKEELKKCELLCSNCHKEKHYDEEVDSLFLEEVKNYKGRLLDI